jgi:CheY-like chemotaxis protein
MFDKTFLKNLTVLFVEDEQLAREKLAKLLDKVFKNVIICENGQEGLNKFTTRFNSDEKIDLIISDINMPIMNGLEMLEKIRDLDKEVPLIYTTARSESENILKAVSLNVSHYILKPIDSEDLLKKVYEICEKQYVEKKLEDTKTELENYINAINKVAVIYKLNIEGKVLNANNMTLDISGYSEDEIKEISFYDLVHPDIPKTSISRSWEEIKKGKSWTGNTKYITKNKEAFYLKCSIFKLSPELNEFITIGFSLNEENSEKREFKKKVMKAIQEFKKNEMNYKKIIIEQNEKLQDLERKLPRLIDELKTEKEKTSSRQRQLDHYELQMHNVDEKYDKFMKDLSKKRDEQTREINELKNEKLLLKNKNNEYEAEISATKKELKLLMETNEQKNKKILDLKDVINSLETKIKEILNPDEASH